MILQIYTNFIHFQLFWDDIQIKLKLIINEWSFIFHKVNKYFYNLAKILKVFSNEFQIIFIDSVFFIDSKFS